MRLNIAIYESGNRTKREPQIYVQDADGYNVARMDVAGRNYHNDPMEYARLVAAAPDLLEACQNIVDLSSGWDEDGALGPRPPLSWETIARMAMDYAHAAIDKTRGEAE